MNKKSTTALSKLVQLLEILDQLEALRTERTYLKKKAQRQIAALRNRYALISGIIAGVMTAIILFSVSGSQAKNFFVFENFVKFGIVTFILSSMFFCILFLLLWENGMLYYFSEKARHKIEEASQKERKRLLKATTELLDSPLLYSSDVPEEYLTPQSVEILQRYIQTSQTDSIFEAVQLFEMDLERQSTRYAKLLKENDSLVNKEREFVEHAVERG